ncbi:DNA repair helicase [Fomitiporia mediterranea MF3/22]|uniref:DNA repair helicase n=1 Tax=Fomitiporia mediterranea (strain MF3/22) TaxID=694068 RepID=UPI0004409259|nr:DNA repair helicase [Fomitiporia mediterranea MF3/22]EJC97956.1 DNA repair helicase [Fomitiporia mediterranea MF3/22]
MSEDILLAIPEEFRAFPYNAPYKIQIDLMQHLYEAIERRKLAVVESPTGTGKTLSLLTSSLTWLHDHKDRKKRITLESLRGSLDSADDPDWVITQTLDRMKAKIEEEERAFEEHLAKLRYEEQIMRKGSARVTKRPRLMDRDASPVAGYDDDIFLPEDQDTSTHRIDVNPILDLQDSKFVSAVHCDCIRYYSFIFRQTVSPASSTKVFFASRTHSQLSQVIHELEKLKPDGFNREIEEDSRISPRNGNGSSSPLPRSVSLASRTHLCINEKLRARTADLDEGCRELLQGRQEDRCPYLPQLGEEDRLHDIRDRILASPKDIEDLVSTGKELRLCPYFGSRSAVSSAELVTLPYNLLLHSRSRQALEIDLTDQVVIVDEAHNLIETLLQLHTVELSTSLLRRAIQQLAKYFSRFRTRLTTNHAVHLKRLLLFLRALENFAGSCSNKTPSVPEHEVVMSVSAFVDNMGSKVNDINFLELHSYLTTSKIAHKVSRYSEEGEVGTEEPTVQKERVSGSVLPVHVVEAFIASLANNAEGTNDTATLHLFADKSSPDEKRIRYQHLNPATHFDEIVQNARCVILAGGTMSPIPDVTLQLFPTIPEDRLSVFSCGHVIPHENLKCVVLGKGPLGRDLEFKYKARDDQSLTDELGQCLSNLVSISPNGIVVFFPSYTFLDRVKSRWTSNGILDRIQKKKQVFFEPHESSEVENVLRDYSIACTQVTTGPTKGALLLAVVGAKLSEGLNFADELARAVVLVGIPYPNLGSPELRERMKYLDKKMVGRGNNTGRAGNELYENLAMRAVNQSIGRAIRHQNDWAALILIDNRYKSQKVQQKLPGWIRQNITTPQSFGQAVKELGEFYRAKRTSR